MWFTLGKLALKTGAEIYKNKKRAKLLQSEAEVNFIKFAFTDFSIFCFFWRPRIATKSGLFFYKV